MKEVNEHAQTCAHKQTRRYLSCTWGFVKVLQLEFIESVMFEIRKEADIARFDCTEVNFLLPDWQPRMLNFNSHWGRDVDFWNCHGGFAAHGNFVIGINNDAAVRGIGGNLH